MTTKWDFGALCGSWLLNGQQSTPTTDHVPSLELETYYELFNSSLI